MSDDTTPGADLETVPDNLPAVEREIEDVEVLMRDTYEYARSPGAATGRTRGRGVDVTPDRRRAIHRR